MKINYPVTNLVGYEARQRLIGIHSGTTVFGATNSIRISGQYDPAEIVVVQEDISPTLRLGAQEAGSRTLTEAF